MVTHQLREMDPSDVIINSHLMLYTAHDIYKADYCGNVHIRLFNEGFNSC